MNNEGIVLDPEIDEALDAEHDPNNPSNREYFANVGSDQLDRLITTMNLEGNNQTGRNHDCNTQ